MELNWNEELNYWQNVYKKLLYDYYDLIINNVNQLSPPNTNILEKIQSKKLSDKYIFNASGLRVVVEQLRLIKIHNQSVINNSKILEIGVGFGRLLNHYLPFTNLDVEINGCDIEDIPVDFCKKNLPKEAIIKKCSLDSLPYQSSVFKYIYAHSVFTHLSKENHRDISSEVARISKPGAMFLCSYFDASNYLDLSYSEYDKLEQQNQTYLWGGPGVRTNFYHTKEQIESYWSKYFSLLQIKNFYKDQTYYVFKRKND